MNPTYILIIVNLFNFSKGEGIASSSFIYLFYLYWYSDIVYFVCDLASEFGAKGSTTSFRGFSYPNLLLVFLNLLFFRNLYHIFLANVGLSLGLFILSLFFCILFWVSL